MSSELTPGDFDRVVALARAAFTAGGGLPLATEPAFLQRRWSGTAFGARDDDGGGLLAAASVRAPATVFLLAAPGAAAGAVLDRALAEAGDGVTVECESVTPEIERLFASRGLARVFAEDVLSIDLTTAAGLDGAPPAGVTLREWDDGTARRFFDVYRASFRDRPGFPDPEPAEWIAEVADDECRPGWTLLARLPGLGDAGFVTAAPGWIVQVGVIPAARGRGLAGTLLRESLRRMRDAGERTVWLTVNVDNQARRVYERLGFTDCGRRARYRRTPEATA